MGKLRHGGVDTADPRSHHWLKDQDWHPSSQTQAPTIVLECPGEHLFLGEHPKMSKTLFHCLNGPIYPLGSLFGVPPVILAKLLPAYFGLCGTKDKESETSLGSETVNGPELCAAFFSMYSDL